MNKKETGGPAFPRPFSSDDADPDLGYPAHVGMTLRDYFAAKAMQAVILHPNGPAGRWEQVAIDCYEAADAMLETRKS